MLDFHRIVKAYNIALDWEAAYATAYQIRVKFDEGEKWRVLFDGKNEQDMKLLKEERAGQSPGVNFKLPLHIVHSINLMHSKDVCFRYLQIYIEKPAAGWGVSIWQADVYGNEIDPETMEINC